MSSQTPASHRKSHQTQTMFGNRELEEEKSPANSRSKAEPRSPETETSNEPARRDDEPTGIYTPTGVQEEPESRDREEIAEEINTPHRQTDAAACPTTYEEETRPLDGSTTTEDTSLATFHVATSSNPCTTSQI